MTLKASEKNAAELFLLFFKKHCNLLRRGEEQKNFPVVAPGFGLGFFRSLSFFVLFLVFFFPGI